MTHLEGIRSQCRQLASRRTKSKFLGSDYAQPTTKPMSRFAKAVIGTVAWLVLSCVLFVLGVALDPYLLLGLVFGSWAMSIGLAIPLQMWLSLDDDLSEGGDQ